MILILPIIVIVSLKNSMSWAYVRFSSVLRRIFTASSFLFLITSNEGNIVNENSDMCVTHNGRARSVHIKKIYLY